MSANKKEKIAEKDIKLISRDEINYAQIAKRVDGKIRTFNDGSCLIEFNHGHLCFNIPDGKADNPKKNRISFLRKYEQRNPAKNIDYTITDALIVFNKSSIDFVLQEDDHYAQLTVSKKSGIRYKSLEEEDPQDIFMAIDSKNK
jgi:hypothetical protein